jgi:hypothetical protein
VSSHATTYTLFLYGSYIQNLDPSYILALAETASFHQVSALRSGVWKHLALQTSIGVKIRVGLLVGLKFLSPSH